jgi:DNA invertase Pin-like site-specific DNA recombinase
VFKYVVFKFIDTVFSLIYIFYEHITAGDTMNIQNIAYCRVSSIDQNLARQKEGMSGIDLDRVFEEKASAKDTNRPVLQECLNYCREGDILHVHSIDRIARNLRDLQDIVDQLVHKSVTVKFHKEGLVFNGNDDAMSKLMLQMMGAFSEFERSLIKERQKEGIAAARKAGKNFGRKKSLSVSQIAEIRQRASSGTPKTLLAAEYGISRTTLYSALS